MFFLVCRNDALYEYFGSYTCRFSRSPKGKSKIPCVQDLSWGFSSKFTQLAGMVLGIKTLTSGSKVKVTESKFWRFIQNLNDISIFILLQEWHFAYNLGVYLFSRVNIKGLGHQKGIASSVGMKLHWHEKEPSIVQPPMPYLGQNLWHFTFSDISMSEKFLNGVKNNIQTCTIPIKCLGMKPWIKTWVPIVFKGKGQGHPRSNFLVI